MSDGSLRRFYWDTSCFICLLNENEQDKRYVCMDILRHAELGNVEVWTSAITISEVIRPKNKFVPVPLPAWCKPVLEKAPAAEVEIRKLWDFFKRLTMPTRKLTDAENKAIDDLFDGGWIKLINYDERVAKESVRIARKYGLKPMDSIHAASAKLKKPPIDEFHSFDKDYSKLSSVLPLVAPQRISDQGEFKQFIRPITQH